ncbi:Fibulin-1 [Varanus komodoensis]|nr:Fibulin-1 [Varanus komodoensis]
MEKAREFQKNIYFCFIDYAKAFDCVVHNNLQQVLKEMGIPDHLICLLRNLYAGQEATVRTGHRITDWFKIEKGVRQSCILSLCLFNLYAEHIMRKAGLDESQVGIKIARRNTNNLRYADDTTLMAESEEELRSLLMQVKKESAKVGLKLKIKKTMIKASGPLTSWQTDGEEMEVVTDFIFLGSKITTDGDCSQEIKRRLLLGRKAMANLGSILKSRNITLPTKVCIVKAMVFPVAMYGCESWTIRKTERQRIEAFELWCWRRLLRVPGTARWPGERHAGCLSNGFAGGGGEACKRLGSSISPVLCSLFPSHFKEPGNQGIEMINTTARHKITKTKRYYRNIAEEQCCLNQLEELHCATGIAIASKQEDCDLHKGNSTCEDKIIKKCCYCCSMGKVAQRQGDSCEQSLLMGYQCGLVFRACCVEEQEKVLIVDGPNKELDKLPQGTSFQDTVSPVEIDPEDIYLHDRCRDINECIISPNSCGIGQICINTLGSFRCQRGTSCGTGYELTEKNLCKDIDECETGTHNCLPDFICQNTPGSFRCRPKQHCKSGFIQDALGNCIDVDECLSSNQPCGEGHICINSPGSYRCECQVGYYFDTISRTCSDVNECRRYPGRLCAHKCENTAGSYYCSCTIGFKLSADARSCEDLNECESNPCSQECANVYGSYQCYCRRGYQLSDIDGITCEDIDECALPTGGHICAYRCINVPGSFQCTCPASGYKLAPNARNCQDIDECVTETHTCSHNETCFNIQGGFRCLSLECPENYRKSGDTVRHEKTDTIRCIKSCRQNDVNCVLDPVHTISHTVISLPTFREFTRPEEIIFLRAITPVYPAAQADIIFDITEGNLRDSFDIIKRYMDGMTVGVVRQVKPIIGPFYATLRLEMNYVVGGVVSHRNVVNVHIFVSEYWF